MSAKVFRVPLSLLATHLYSTEDSSAGSSKAIKAPLRPTSTNSLQNIQSVHMKRNIYLSWEYLEGMCSHPSALSTIAWSIAESIGRGPLSTDKRGFATDPAMGTGTDGEGTWIAVVSAGGNCNKGVCDRLSGGFLAWGTN